jgi:hypothetical protein
MDNLIEKQVEEAVSNMIVGAVKSLARHNKTAASLLTKVTGLDKKVAEHNEFLDDLIAILKPALHLAHGVLATLLPGYLHIIDWVTELCKDVYAGVTASA